MANYNSIHTGAEIDAAISQMQILGDSARGVNLQVSVSTSGSATPADPLNDPFDNLTNAVKWVSENHALVGYLYVEMGSGTFVEGGLHPSPNLVGSTWQVPTNIYHVDVWGYGASSTIVNFGTRTLRDGDSSNVNKISFSGAKVIAKALRLWNGTESYDDFTFQSSSATGFDRSILWGICKFYGNVTFIHGGSTDLTRPILEFENATVNLSNVGTLTITPTTNPASGRLINIRNSIVNLDSVTVVNSGSSSMNIYAGPGATLMEPGTLTNCTTTFDDLSIPTRAQAALL